MRAFALALLAALPPAPVAAADRQPASAATATPAAAEPKDKLVCKRFPVIGSLVATRKECKSRRDWETERAAIRENFSSGACNSQNGTGC